MNVVYASNDRYARHLCVSLCSLLENNRRMEDIRVFILSVGMGEESRRRILGTAERFGRTAEFLELGDLRERFSYEIDTRGFDISALSRLFMGEMLPDLDRVLYLDCDTVILRQLDRLWGLDLKGRVLGMAMEPTIYPSIKAQIGLSPEEPYFNSGVLLVDLKAWRAQGVQGSLLEFYRRMGGNLFACDQDTINGVLKGKIRAISPRYNFFTNYRYFPYRELVRLCPAYAWIPEEELRAAKRHPAIVHYMGDERPWIAGNLNHYRRAYDLYLSRTPWKGAGREEGKRLYMLAYHLMDYMTAICPGARRAISRGFGMKAIDWRQGGDVRNGENGK